MHMENQTLSQIIPKTPLYEHMAQMYKEKRTKKHQQQQIGRGGGGQLSPRKARTPQQSQSRPQSRPQSRTQTQTQPLQLPKPQEQPKQEPVKPIYKGRASVCITSTNTPFLLSYLFTG